MKYLVFCATSDLNYDQRMIRICQSLHRASYKVLLIGCIHPQSKNLVEQEFAQKRLLCFFKTGKLFYLEYNIRLFFYLLFLKLDLICAVDLDTILPCYLVSVIRRKKKVYDAHELFCEMKEIVSRPIIYKIWKTIEKSAVPRYKNGYTVCTPIQNVFKKRYGVEYEVIMNMPFQQEIVLEKKDKPFILYQGAVNQGRSFETLIPAFQWINSELWIYGNGNFVSEAKQLIVNYDLVDKVLLKGWFLPKDLKKITQQAYVGITLFENEGLSNYYSLANRFFDYIQAGIPQVCVNYPAYKEINDQFEVAILIDDLSSGSIANAINKLLNNETLYNRLKQNCLKARLVYNWESQEKKLISFYQRIFH